jgi:GNAT superfamily N-acetyltransferase
MSPPGRARAAPLKRHLKAQRVMILRPAKPSDSLAVAEVHVRSWQVGYRGLLPGDYLDTLIPEQRAARYTFADRSFGRPWTTVAVEDGLICGFATTGPATDSETPASGELLGLYVDPSHWSKGVGRALIAAARRELAGRGFPDTILWVLSGNERAQRFYRQDGWRPDGSQRLDEVWGIPARDLRYRRGLP